MTIVDTQNILYCSSISAFQNSEFENILDFKVLDLRVFFNLQLESAQSDIGRKCYGQNTNIAQNWKI